MKNFLILTFIFTYSLISAQTIINTESLMKEIDSTFAVKLNIEGNLNFGNIKLAQLNNSVSVGKKISKSLLRLSFSHEYISEDSSEIANDWSGQLRFNRFYNDNSIFLFLQGQNVISLKLNHRYLIGVGFRKRFFSKNTNYFDFSLGSFYEDELYQKNEIDEARIYNWRYSLSSFSNIKISKSLSLNTSAYYQLKTSNLDDSRLFLEPRLYFEIDKFNFYLTCKYRYHTTPYVDILSEDTELLFGIEIDI